MPSFVIEKFHLADSWELNTEEKVKVKVECCPPVDKFSAILEKRQTFI